VSESVALMDLMRAIVADDEATVSRLVLASPELASSTLVEGATRESVKDHWFEI
jgi:hypothetical protein